MAARIENANAMAVLEAVFRLSLEDGCAPIYRRLTEAEASTFPFLSSTCGTPWLVASFDNDGRAAFVTRRLSTADVMTARTLLSIELGGLCDEPGIPMPSSVAGSA